MKVTITIPDEAFPADLPLTRGLRLSKYLHSVAGQVADGHGRGSAVPADLDVLADWEITEDED